MCVARGSGPHDERGQASGTEQVQNTCPVCDNAWGGMLICVCGGGMINKGCLTNEMIADLGEGL